MVSNFESINKFTNIIIGFVEHRHVEFVNSIWEESERRLSIDKIRLKRRVCDLHCFEWTLFLPQSRKSSCNPADRFAKHPRVFDIADSLANVEVLDADNLAPCAP